MTISLRPIGTVSSPRVKPQDDHWGNVVATIELDGTKFTESALQGLTEFSHAEIIFYMDQVPSEKIETAARHPRNNQNWPQVGIFAQRGKNRPNQLGSTVCRILRIDGLKLVVEGLDAIHQTPVLDIKPFLEEFAPRGPIRQAPWSKELMKDYF